MPDQLPASPDGERKFAPVDGTEGGKDGRLGVMRKRLARSMTANRENAARYAKDMGFLIADDQGQWAADIKAARDAQKRPVLQFNLLPKFFFQVSNEIKQATPGFQVKPEQGDATTDAALIIEGMLRHINNRSMGAEARESACDCAIAGGFGYWGVTTSYVNDTDPDALEGEAPITGDREARLFQQEIRIRHIANPLCCHDDPEARLPDWSDRRFFFIEEMVPLDDFKVRYPDANVDGFTQEPQAEGEMSGWWRSDAIRTVEYWYIEEKWRKVEGSSGKSRRIADRKIKWCIATAFEILEEGDWPGRWIPFMRVNGWMMNLNGKRHVESLIHQSLDPQIAYNYMETAKVERVGLHALAPWLMVDGQNKGHEGMWQEANSAAHAALVYAQVGLADNSPAPPPQRIDPPPPSQDLIAASDSAKAQVYDSMRMSPPALGQESATPTATQEKYRRMESDTGNYHFIRSLKTALAFEGRVIQDLIPRVYDVEQVVRVVGEDGTAKMVPLNPKRLDGMKRVSMRVDKEDDGYGGIRPVKKFDLGVGAYEVLAEMGPAFNTQIEQARAEVAQWMVADRTGSAASILMPFVVRMSNMRERDIIAELLEATWPQPLQDIKAKMGQGDDRASAARTRNALVMAMQRMQQMQQVIQAMQAELTDTRQKNYLKALEIEMKEETARIQTIANITATTINAEAKLLEAGFRYQQLDQAAMAAGAAKKTGDEAMAQTERVVEDEHEEVKNMPGMEGGGQQPMPMQPGMPGPGGGPQGGMPQ